jgi:hypothetical protein
MLKALRKAGTICAGAALVFTMLGSSPASASEQQGEPVAAAASYTALLPYVSNGRIYAKARVTNAPAPRKICVQLWYTNPPRIPQGPLTGKYCSRSYYTSGSAWVWIECRARGLYFTKAWFYNRSGTLIAERTSKLKQISSC